MIENPYLFEINSTIPFAGVLAGQATDAVQKKIAFAKQKLQALYTEGELNFENTLGELDALLNEVSKTYGAIYLMAFTHPEEEVRNDAQTNIPIVEQFFSEVQLDEELYKRVLEYSKTREAEELTGAKRKFLEDTLADFKRNGFALPANTREVVKEIKKRLSEVSSQFDANIVTAKDELLLGEDEVQGLPNDYLQARKQADGRYKIDLSYPSYRPFMKYAQSGKARKELMSCFLNRASGENNKILREIVDLRQELAENLGYRSFAEYQLENKMAKTPQEVWSFEEDIQQKVMLKAETDYEELLKIKQEIKPDADKIDSWETAFLENLLLEKEYQLDEQELKQYFELNNVIDGLFHVCESLFGITFVEQQGASVWHQDVKYYSVVENEREIGHFYLDLFPRDDKYGHAAMFPIVSGRADLSGYETPKAALVCNFPKPAEDVPSLLTHGDVETFFHEFGHLLHGLLTTAELASQAGTSVSRDFVETPSQIFEQWAWNYESLKKFAKHYETGEVLPKSLHEKMIASKNVNSGNYYLQQIFYGTIDMRLHDQWQEFHQEEFADILKELQESITKFPFIDGTNMHASFGHLNGYAAGYYGYLWAKVYAEDFYSVFEQDGVMNPEIGKRYRDIVLAQGSTVDPAQIVREFLGREPQSNAFLRNIGLEV